MLFLFDKKTKSLGLFQLKWQDKYSSDLVARRSRISNFYPKAIEWVDKMDQWVSLNNPKSILNALCIDDTEISNVYFFVIGRYNTHFSNQTTDERAAWGSWYHLVELYHKIKIEFDDPVKELYFKLKADSPRNTSIKDKIDKNPKLELENFSITFTNV